MEPVKIVTDSTANLPEDLVRELDIAVIPASLTLDKRTCREGVDITPEKFYRHQDLYHTALCAPPEYHDYAIEYGKLAKRHKQMLVLHTSAGFADFFAVAAKVHEDFRANHGSRVVLMDVGGVSLGLGLIVMLAARAAGDGKRLHELQRLVHAAVKNRMFFVGVGDVAPLKKQGLVGGFSGLTGSLPVLSMNGQGKLVPGKSKLKKKTLVPDLLKAVEEKMGDYELILGLTDTLPDRLYGLVHEAFEDRFVCREVVSAPAFPSLGMAVGADAVGVACIRYDAVRGLC